MRRTPWSDSHVRLVVVFLVLVLVPSIFLGYFSLRAVEAERRAARVRVLENYERYAEIASRAVRQQLVELESSWQDLVPAREGWGARLADIGTAFEPGALAERSIAAAWIFGLDGVELHAGREQQPRIERADPLPTATEAHLLDGAVTRADAAEFDGNDPARAAAIYAELASRVANPRLRAIAWTEQARAALLAGDSAMALAASRRVLAEHPQALDLDNQPLHLVARLQIARTLEDRGAHADALDMLVELADDLRRTAPELAPSQFGFFRDRIDESLTRLAAAMPQAQRNNIERQRQDLRQLAKAPVGDLFFARKLQRKLVRAVTDEQLYSTRWRYVSDVAEEHPYLLAYTFLPDPTGTRVGGLLGLAVDLDHLSRTVLPDFLHELELSAEATLEIVDESGRRVIGESAPAGVAAIVESNLGEPFEFWNVAVRGPSPDSANRSVAFRTRVFLYLILVLLLTIAAGAVLLTVGLRRQARLAALKTSFVSSVSHELRTPLTSIRMYAEMLEMSGDRMTTSERQRQLAVIGSECQRLERLIDAVLDFASLQRGTKRFHFEYEEVGELVRRVAEDFREQAEAKGFRFEVQVDADLPEVRVDADAIRQVMLNLLSNAVKYSEDDRWIAVRAFRRRDEVGIEVEDHGIGIDPADQERIFDDFYRVDQRLSSARQGVGLGLTLVRRIVGAHHGRVTVDSAPQRGSRFTVWLPVEPAGTGATPPRAGGIPQEA